MLSFHWGIKMQMKEKSPKSLNIAFKLYATLLRPELKTENSLRTFANKLDRVITVNEG